MPLPDLAALAALDARALGSITDRLRRLGVTLAAAQPIYESASGVPAMLQPAVRAMRARQVKTPLGHAMRVLLFGDTIDRDQARAAFGETLDLLLSCGLLVEGERGLSTPFVIGIVDDLYVVADVIRAGGDAVMGLGPTTTVLARAARSQKHLKNVLEIGTGAGTIALVLAKRAQRVVATDVNPRALQLARINVALNGVKNVELREGSLFEPVRGEAFDLVVSQPPFVARPNDTANTTFLHGGARGDELVRALLRDLPEHLAPEGRAVLFIEWPLAGEEEIDVAVHEIVGDRANVLVLASPPATIDLAASTFAAASHPGLGSAFFDELVRRHDHLSSLGVRALLPTLTVLERAKGKAWFASLPVAPVGTHGIDGDRIGRFLAARKLANDANALKKAKLRVPDGVRLAQEQLGPGADVPSEIHAYFPPDVGLQRATITTHQLFLLTHVHEATNVEEGIAEFVKANEIDDPDVFEGSLAAVGDALKYGLLQIA